MGGGSQGDATAGGGGGVDWSKLGAGFSALQGLNPNNQIQQQPLPSSPTQQPQSQLNQGAPNAQQQDYFQLLMDDLYQRFKARAAEEDSGYDTYSKSDSGFSM